MLLPLPKNHSRLRTSASPARFFSKSTHVPGRCSASNALLQDDCTFIHSPDAVMLQGFGWDSCEHGHGWYRELHNQIETIKGMNVSQIWLPPPSQSVSRQGYLPGQLYDLETPYGTGEDLKQLLQALKAAGIAPLADIVINHRCADQQDSNGRWNIFTDRVEHPGKSIAWGQWAIVGGDGFGGMGSVDSGAVFEPAPDLDHKNEAVRESLKDWMRWLQDHVGYVGWRLDYIKGYAPRFVKEYIMETTGPHAPNVGELWTDMHWDECKLASHQDGARQALCDVLDSTDASLNLFDFPTKGILQEAMRNCEYWRLQDSRGRPPGLIGWWAEKAVTFIDNHDTGSTQRHWPFPDDNVMAGYAYLFTHPGVPCVLHEHAFKWGLSLKLQELADIRRRNGLHSKSCVSIKAAENDMYVAHIDDRVAIKLGPRYDMGDLKPSRQAGWDLCASGHEYAVWERSGSQ